MTGQTFPMKNLFPETKIFFAEKLSQRITPLLEKMGFRLVTFQVGNSENNVEALVYQRPNPDFDRPDNISLYGEYSITGEAYSKGVVLPNIRELLPNYQFDDPDTHYWYYQDAESLMLRIEEIADFIETILPNWFVTLDPNPSQIPRSAIQLSRQEMEALLKRNIANLTSAIAYAQASGLTGLVETYEWELANVKRILLDLEQYE